MANDEGYVRATSDNLPKVDSLMLMEFATSAEQYVSAEIKNIKSDRSMRESYISSGVGRVCLKRDRTLCSVNAEVCPEHRQRVQNYKVEIIVDEEKETIQTISCLSCAASQGGCKHALAFLMWLCKESSKPSPTEVESYWNKPRLSNISVNSVAKTSDFGEVASPTGVDVAKSVAAVTSPSAPLSSFQRYNCEVEEVSQLDLNYMFLQFVRSRGQEQGAPTPEAFRRFCSSFMTEAACDVAFKSTAGQTDSRQWHLLRYGRITASTIYQASRSQIEGGGVLKELILGGTELRFTEAMQRGKNLEPQVLRQVKKKLKLKKVEEVGVQLSPEHPEFGASPDGLGEDFVIEIKSPSKEETVKTYLKDGKPTPKCLAQIQLQMKFCKRSRGFFFVLPRRTLRKRRTLT